MKSYVYDTRTDQLVLALTNNNNKQQQKLLAEVEKSKRK